MDKRLALMCGTDIPVPECGLIMHQPKIKEIAMIGETEYFIGIQTLTINKSMFVQQGGNDLSSLSNFQIFMMVMNEKSVADKREAVISVCSLLFPDYKLTLTPRSMVFTRDGNTFMVDGENFDALQIVIKEVSCAKNGPMDQQAFNPVDAKAQEIAKKLMRGRERVAAQKNESNVSVFTQYISILTVGLGSMSLQNMMDLTMFQLYDLVERYMLYVNWDIDLRSRLAGGKPDHEVDNWMKNIH